jgi:hypothetical protein
MFEPLAATQCYPLVFMTILNYAADVTPTAEIGPVAEGLKFVAAHAGQARNKIDKRWYYRGQSTSYVPSLSTITAVTSRCFPLTTAWHVNERPFSACGFLPPLQCTLETLSAP